MIDRRDGWGWSSGGGLFVDVGYDEIRGRFQWMEIFSSGLGFLFYFRWWDVRLGLLMRRGWKGFFPWGLIFTGV